MAHTELGLRERRTIEDMLNAKMSVDKIAAEIGRHRSTVCGIVREIDPVL
jgi:IS30 family transposase